MYIFPAIDLYDGKAVRLFKGDYAQMTVYSENPIEIARDFEAKGAKFIHMVDLEGARDGSTPNLSIVADVAQNTSLFVEIGGGIRDMETVETYLSAGVSRVILGTAAVNNETFLREAVAKYGERIAVGADVKDGYIAIKGWQEQSAYTLEAFMEKMQSIGVRTIICTDISKDGAMKGTNRQLYRELSAKFSMDIVASGGVSDMEDIRALTAMNLYGAITGRADDMIKVKGVAVFPSQIEKALLKVSDVEPHYQIIVTRPDILDEIEVKVEASQSLFFDGVKEMMNVQNKIADYIQNEIGIRVKVTLVEPKSLPRATKGKAKRVIDKRNLH